MERATATTPAPASTAPQPNAPQGSNPVLPPLPEMPADVKARRQAALDTAIEARTARSEAILDDLWNQTCASLQALPTRELEDLVLFTQGTLFEDRQRFSLPELRALVGTLAGFTLNHRYEVAALAKAGFAEEEAPKEEN